jgi:CheY-like chemotaxis protein
VPRILVVEDDQPIRDVTKRILSAAGYDTLAAESGARGIQLWRDQHADLLITDVRLSDMDGLMIVVQLRSEAPRLPVIVMSGDTSAIANLTRDVPELASIAFLPKPFVRAELLAVVADELEAAGRVDRSG